MAQAPQATSCLLLLLLAPLCGVTTAVPPPRHDCAFAGPFYRADVDSIGACYDACAIDTNCGGFSFAG